MPDERPFLRYANPVIWPALALILGWGMLITQLRHHWGGESYYNFGWFVPALTGWLLFRGIESLTPLALKSYKTPLIIGIASITLILPFHALSEVNPFWRVPLWAQACGLYAFSLSVLYAVYGKSGIRAGIFPLFFLCTMIPWPYRIEVIIIQALTKLVVVLAMNGIHLLGYPVELAGNSFVLGDVQIGVNEACSGIRSLQALFMVTLFLGSLFGQGKARRIVAVMILPLIVIVVNSFRATFLSLQVIVNGDAAYEAWHDPAGYIAFGISMIMIYACIEILNLGGGEKDSGQPVSPRQVLDSFSTWKIKPSFMVFCLFPILVYTSVEAWFLAHEWNEPPSREWELVLPESDDPSLQVEEIHPQIAGILGFSYGERIVYRPPQGNICELYYYGYTSENKLESVSSYGHSPLICMEAIGATKLKDYPNLLIEVDDFAIPMKHYLFELNKTKDQLHVFWIVWEKRNQGISPDQLTDLDYSTQFVQLMKGRRDFSRKVLLMSVYNTPSEERSRDIVSNLLSRWIRAQQSTD